MEGNHAAWESIKFIASLVLLFVILGLFYKMSFVNVFLISAVLGIVSYVLGDMVILPRTNNTIAAAADFGLSLILIWYLSSILTYGNNPFTMSLVTSARVALFEYFFHGYLVKNLTEDSTEKGTFNQGNLRYNTEASEELAPVKPDVRSDDKE
ncbi:YndM family protein [Cytobacillus sp. NCCP-133]|uniref:YndM family protein n=1 Tax=Cytobacillus sp. NCCP-133 TaxID=766848 RepID=UPI00222FD627|nr:YndM family protein [Cytobacillus sp. NCCP-133]GLB61299.1 hypothetical protein NCCP133_34290 [Cytobacillus sp. NCCP-133]